MDISIYLRVFFLMNRFPENHVSFQEKNLKFFQIFFKNLLHFQKRCDIILNVNGPLVKRLRRSPLKAESWVRFPYGSPIKTNPN